MSLTSCHSNIDGNISKFGKNKPIEILKIDYIIFALQRSEEWWPLSRITKTHRVPSGMISSVCLINDSCGMLRSERNPHTALSAQSKQTSSVSSRQIISTVTVSSINPFRKINQERYRHESRNCFQHQINAKSAELHLRIVYKVKHPTIQCHRNCW